MRLCIDFADSDDPRPTREPAPLWLLNRYVRRRMQLLAPAETIEAIGQQQALRRRAGQRWQAELELDFGVVVDEATGVYVYGDTRRPVAALAPLRPMPAAAASAKRPKCARCGEWARPGKAACRKHLEQDRLRHEAARSAA
jgi:hypothetical protein